MAAPPVPDPVCRLGVLAFGDSITNGGGELQWGVAMKSWAEWVARGLGVPFTGCAVDGAVLDDVLEEQIPRFERTARPGGTFDLGCLYIGVNDVRRPDWDGAAFAEGFSRALDWLAGRCERRLVVTAPLDLGRPRAGGKVLELDRIVEERAAAHGALMVDLRGLRARNLLMSDHVHLTAFGQVALAERALDVLAGDGARIAVRPRALIRPAEATRWRRLRADLSYAYRHAKVSGRAGGVLAAAALSRRSARWRP